MPSPNIILRGRYCIIQQLGHGGVTQSINRWTRASVVWSPSKGPAPGRATARVRREAQVLAKLIHPTPLRVIDHFAHGEGQFFVRPFVPSHDLVESVESKESLTAHLNAVAKAFPTGLLHNSHLGLNLSTFI